MCLVCVTSTAFVIDAAVGLDMIGNLCDCMTISPAQFRDAKNDTEVGIWLLVFQS